MYITPSQKYQITRALNNKVNKIAASMSRVLELKSADSIRKMIKQRIARDLKLQFEFGAIGQLPESHYEQYIEALSAYQYFYRDQPFK